MALEELARIANRPTAAQLAGRGADPSRERIDRIVVLNMALERATAGDGLYWSPENGMSL